MSFPAFPPPALPGGAWSANLAVPAARGPAAAERRVTPPGSTARGALTHDLLGQPPPHDHRAPPSLIQIAIAARLREQQAVAQAETAPRNLPAGSGRSAEAHLGSGPIDGGPIF